MMLGEMAAMDDTVTTSPAPFPIMAGRSARVSMAGPSVFTSMTARHSSGPT